MARRRYGRRRRGHKSVPVLSLAIVAGQALLANAGGGDIAQKVSRFASYYVALDFGSGVFDPRALVIGWGPWLAKGFIGKIARSVGARPRLLPGLSLS